MARKNADWFFNLVSHSSCSNNTCVESYLIYQCKDKMHLSLAFAPYCIKNRHFMQAIEKENNVKIVLNCLLEEISDYDFYFSPLVLHICFQ